MNRHLILATPLPSVGRFFLFFEGSEEVKPSDLPLDTILAVATHGAVQAWEPSLGFIHGLSLRVAPSGNDVVVKSVYQDRGVVYGIGEGSNGTRTENDLLVDLELYHPNSDEGRRFQDIAIGWNQNGLKVCVGEPRGERPEPSALDDMTASDAEAETNLLEFLEFEIGVMREKLKFGDDGVG